MSIKICNRCHLEKDIEAFDMFHRTFQYGRCKSCAATIKKIWWASRSPELKDKHKSYRKSYWGNLSLLEKTAHYTRVKARSHQDPRHALWRAAKNRAKKNNIPFSIVVEDIYIPMVCPLLGTPIKKSFGKQSANSPTLDKVIPELGYISGNICVISQRANALKSDAAAETHQKIADYIRGFGGR